jgi:RNA ligase-like protein
MELSSGCDWKTLMETYSTINGPIQYDLPVIVFDKIDGQQFRAEWNSKRGFYKFGSRKQLIDPSVKPWNEAAERVKEKYEADLTKLFKEEGWKSALCFFEFYGPNSFAGQHQDEKHDVILFDIQPEGYYDLLIPEEFLDLCCSLDIPKILFRGYMTGDLVEQIRSSQLEGMTFEGVVCKARHEPTMFKIKSRAWLEKLKEHCGGNDRLFQELA